MPPRIISNVQVAPPRIVKKDSFREAVEVEEWQVVEGKKIKKKKTLSQEQLQSQQTRENTSIGTNGP